jgi:putative transposase
MVLYRRDRTPGATYFFTVTLRDRNARVLVDHVDYLRHAFALTRRERPFRVDAIVVLPDHLHAVWTLPSGDDDFSSRWRAIKGRFTRVVSGLGVAVHRNARGEFDLWQSRYWEHRIRDDEDLQRHVDYCHFNPVKHGHVARPEQWPYSSFHRYVREGVIDPSWAVAPEGEFGGER